ncbi:MAG TPA: ATP-binding protein [Casimicrobiaceae bacterium]|nr:ATP-binding protein [Casimicrobiaceae bacterium]
MHTQSREELDLEISLLRERLESAEDMRRAITSQELDGFVVGQDAHEPRVVLLDTSAVAASPFAERLPHGAVTLSRDGRVLYANQRFASMVGRPLWQLFSLAIDDIVAPESRASMELFISAALPDAQIEAGFHRGDGSPLHARLVCIGLTNGHVSLLVTDLGATDPSQEAQEALLAIHEGEIDAVVVGGDKIMLVPQADSPYRMLVDRMSQGAVTVTAQGDILYVNDRFAAMVGRQRQALLGKPVDSVLAGGALEGVLANARSDVAAEVTITRSDGSTMPVAVTIQRVDGNEALTLVLTDLTERDRHRDIQERARRNDQFLTVLAHELRNPLGSIRNAVEILDRSAGLGDDERYAVNVIGRQSETLARLVDDLLDVHRLNEGKVVLRRQPLDIRQVIGNCIEATRPTLAAKQQSVEVHLPDEPLHVNADAVRLAQVLGNLLVNASKFTDKGGCIRVTLQRRTRESGEGVARMEVIDNGIGIAPELLSAIFDPYVQAPHEAQRFPQGLGLGLSVARRLVALHNGTIHAESEGRGRGSTFVLEFPLCNAPLADIGEGAAEPAANRRLRILIADDDADNAKSLSTLLEILGHETYSARNGEEAVAMAEQLRPHAAILDIGMPGMDGHAAARALRERPWAQGLILYALTGWGQARDRDRTREAGFDRHFVKPVEVQELTADLDGRFNGSQPRA